MYVSYGAMAARTHRRETTIPNSSHRPSCRKIAIVVEEYGREKIVLFDCFDCLKTASKISPPLPYD
jgi:hypothetical protein